MSVNNVDRQLFSGELPRARSLRSAGDVDDSDYLNPNEPLSLEEVAASHGFNGSEVIPIFMRPRSDNQRGDGWDDHSAEIIMGDVPEQMTMTPFEQSQAEYHGYNFIGRLSLETFDGDRSSFL